MPINKKRRALLIVDLQNDFIQGGALAVPEGDEVVPLVDQLVKQPFDTKVATKDWHPPNHGSFAATHGKKLGETIFLDGIPQILWPVHCVQGSKGAEFVPGWDTSQIEKVFYKGTKENLDSYSTFFDNQHRYSTGLLDYLCEKQITELYVAGLATDYCVKYSVLDALNNHLETYVITDACRGVNLTSSDSTTALKEMQDAGAHLISFNDVINRYQHP